MNLPTIQTGHFSAPRTRDALEYSWQQLAQRIGIIYDDAHYTELSQLSINVYYSPLESIQPRSPGIVIIPCRDTAWDDLLERPPNSLPALPASSVAPLSQSLPWDKPTPILFWGQGYENGLYPFAEHYKDGIIIFYADIIAATFFMLSRWEETIDLDRDQHGRFQATSSVAYKQGFLDRPIVDEYALILRTWLQAILPNFEFKSRTFSVKLSHDIDSIRSYLTYRSAARVFRDALMTQHDLIQGWKILRNLIWQISLPSKDPRYQRIRWLAQMSRQHNLESAFYFIAADPSARNRHEYDMFSPLMQQCLRDLQGFGAEIGLHAGYETFDNPEKLSQEKARFESALGRKKKKLGGRQHYLRFQVPETWRYWEQAGLAYDSTLGYASHEGFRCGTCHPFNPFDLALDRKLDLMEFPLIVMDQTLKTYQKMTPEQGEKRIIELAQKCKQVGGTFTMLWHNTSLDGEWKPWVHIYERVLESLTEMQT